MCAIHFGDKTGTVTSGYGGTIGDKTGTLSNNYGKISTASVLQKMYFSNLIAETKNPQSLELCGFLYYLWRRGRDSNPR